MILLVVQTTMRRLVECSEDWIGNGVEEDVLPRHLLSDTEEIHKNFCTVGFRV
jgi:hypothetical protein